MHFVTGRMDDCPSPALGAFNSSLGDEGLPTGLLHPSQNRWFGLGSYCVWQCGQAAILTDLSQGPFIFYTDTGFFETCVLGSGFVADGRLTILRPRLPMSGGIAWPPSLRPVNPETGRRGWQVGSGGAIEAIVR